MKETLAQASRPLIEQEQLLSRRPAHLAEKLEAIKLTGRDGIEKAILVEVAQQEGRRLRCCLESFPTMARRLGFGERTLRDRWRRLQRDGLLNVQSKATQTSRGTVNWEALVAAAQTPAAGAGVAPPPAGDAAINSGSRRRSLRREMPETPARPADKGFQEGFLTEGGTSPVPAAPSWAGKFQKFAVESWQAVHGGRKPTWGKKDFVALAKAVEAHPEMSNEELQGAWENFLASGERFLVKRGHQPADFLSHFDALRDGPLLHRADGTNRQEATVGRLREASPEPAAPAPALKLACTVAQRNLGETIWAKVLAYLKPSLDPQTFSTWFRPTRGIGVSGQNLFVEVPNEIFSRWLSGEGATHVAEGLRERAPQLAVKYLPSGTFELSERQEPPADGWQCPPGCIPPHGTKVEHNRAVLAAAQAKGFIGRLEYPL